MHTTLDFISAVALMDVRALTTSLHPTDNICIESTERYWTLLQMLMRLPYLKTILATWILMKRQWKMLHVV